MRKILWLAALVAALATSASALAVVQNETGTTTFNIALEGPGGTGTAELTLNPSGKVCYAIEVTLTTTGDVPNEPPGSGLGNAHIHVLPSGGIAVDLESSFESLGGGTFASSDCVRADKDVVRAIIANPEQYYVNVHSVAFPGGAITGTLA